jgi:hypothetical protein
MKEDSIKELAKMLWLASEQQWLLDQINEIQIKIDFAKKTEEGLIKERDELKMRLADNRKELEEMVNGK